MLNYFENFLIAAQTTVPTIPAIETYRFLNTSIETNVNTKKQRTIKSIENCPIRRDMSFNPLNQVFVFNCWVDLVELL